MPCLRGRRLGVVVQHVEIAHRRARELFRRHAIEAIHAHGDDVGTLGVRAAGERPYAARGAEHMVQALLAKLVFAQRLLAGQQVEVRGRYEGHPGARLEAARAVALERALRKVDRRLVAHRAAMAAPLVGLLHRGFAFHNPIMRPSGSVKRLSLPMPGTFCSSTWILPPAATIFLRYAARSSTRT